jgi:hypothetical protein
MRANDRTKRASEARERAANRGKKQLRLDVGNEARTEWFL